MVKSARISYNPALDGLRALGILSVLAFHLEIPGSAAGFLGVDVFFVLSGYLITAYLVAEWQASGGVRFSRFYVRRLLRLVPALAVFLVVWGFLVPVVPIADVIVSALGAANWAIALNLVKGMNERPFVHLWSLALEWQYYLLWPVVLVLLLRSRLSRRRVVLVLIVLALASGFWRGLLWHLTGNFERVHYGLDTRADGLLLGSAVALLLANGDFASAWRGRPALRLGTYAAGAVVFGLLLSSRPFDFYMYGAHTVLVCATAGLLLGMVVDPPAPLQAIFANRIAVWIGLISYGLYLWHVPIKQYLLGMLGYQPQALDTLLLTCGLALAAAFLSYHIIELPALRLKARLGSSLQRAAPARDPAPQ